MRILARYGRDDLAILYLAELPGGDARVVEFVESVQPPSPREDRWVLIVSSGLGCPVRCAICDAGSHFHGWLSPAEILAQVDYLVANRFGGPDVPVRKFKIQFARMGEPALNPSVLDVLEELPGRYRAPGLMPCLSTIAPAGRDPFFERLLRIKNERYPVGRFRLQFSIHSTDPHERAALIPRRTWSLERISDYGRRFHRPGDAKVCLNFAPAREVSISADILARAFDPETFVVKLTPVNPTDRALGGRFVSLIDENRRDPAAEELVSSLKASGFDVVVSIGETEENAIGTNCGQMAARFVGGRLSDLPYATSSYAMDA